MKRKKAKPKAKLKSVDSAKHHYQPFKKVRGVSSLYRYYSRSGKAGSYYMIARVDGVLKKECLKTSDLDFAKKKILDRKKWLKGKKGERTLMQLACDFKEATTKNQKHSIWVINHLKECPFASQSVQKISKDEIARFIKSLNLGSRSTNLFYERLKAVFDWGVPDFLQDNPMSEAKYRKQIRKKVVREKPNAPTLEEFAKIVDCIRNQKFSDTAQDSADLVEYLGLAGQGVAEANALDWNHVNFSGQMPQISVQRKKTQEFYYVPIHNNLMFFLQALHIRRGEPESGKVFKVLNPKKAIDSACAKLNLKQYTARNFRQMNIIHNLRSGVAPKTIARWQGHQDGGVLIMKVYSEVISENDLEYEINEVKKIGQRINQLDAVVPTYA
jgi:integrase